FGEVAEIALLVQRNSSAAKPRKLQFSSQVIFDVLQRHEPEHVLMRQAWHDVFHECLDMERASDFLKGAIGKPMRLKQVDHLPPLSFAIFAAKMTQNLPAEEARQTTQRLFHLWWTQLQSAVATD